MARPLKICMITTFYPPYNFGGDGIFIYRLTNELAARGHSVDVIHCRDSYLLLEPRGPKGDFPNHANVTVHGLKSPWGRLSPLLTQQTGYPLLKKRKIDAILKEKGFDVIHYHNISLVGGPGLLEPRPEITLYTTHEHWLVCPMHVLWKYNREACTKRNCLSCCILGRRPPQLWRYTGLIRRKARNVDCFISPSRFTLKKHREMGLDAPFIHMPYFIPSSEEGSFTGGDKAPGAARRPYFLFVGRLEKIKGLQHVIPLFRDYRHADLLIAGDGEYADVLKGLAGGIDSVRFLGRVDHEGLRRLYHGAIALVVPSICYEVFGIIILEAFSMKTPVIVNNVGAPPDVIEESGGGFIYNNADELIEAMDRLRCDTALRDELALKGYNAYRRYWTEDNCMRIYFNLIAQLAGKKGIDLDVPCREREEAAPSARREGAKECGR